MVGEEHAEPFRLRPALLAERPRGVRAGPGLRIPGVGVADEVEQHQTGCFWRDGRRTARTRSPIWMKTLRNTASRSSSVPSAAAGSS